jgi:hypothetical protein
LETACSVTLEGKVKLSRRNATILLVIGIYMLLTWGTRVFTFLAEFRAGTLVAPAIHFSLVVIGLAIGVYLAYLGIRGRRAAS